MAADGTALGRVVATTLTALLAAAPSAALQFDNGGSYQPARHSRFLPGSYPALPVPNPDYFLAAYEAQLAGIGWQANAPDKKAALLSPQHFLNADHYKLGGQISFRGADGRVHTYAIAANERVAGDIAIGTLQAPIPAQDGVPYFRIASVAPGEHVGREVLYVGNAPGASDFAVGRTAVRSSAGTGSVLQSSLVDPAVAADRVHGVGGDSGSPSFFENGGELLLVGHHYTSYNDQYIGYGPTWDALDDFLAADGQLLEAAGHSWHGDPAHGDVVVTRLSERGWIELETHQLGAVATGVVRFHDFSGLGTTLRLSTEGIAFLLRDPATASLIRQIEISLPAGAAGVPVEVAFTAPRWGLQTGILRIDGGAATVEIPLAGDAVDPESPCDSSFDPGCDGTPAAPVLLRSGS